MSRADLCSVWGNNLRPLLLAGDPLQLSPTVMNEKSKDIDGKYLNRFGPDGKMSALGFLQGTGFAVYRLWTQFRMCQDMLGLAKELVYADLVDFQYGPDCNPDLLASQYRLDNKQKDASEPKLIAPVRQNIQGALLQSLYSHLTFVVAIHEATPRFYPQSFQSISNLLYASTRPMMT